MILSPSLNEQEFLAGLEQYGTSEFRANLFRAMVCNYGELQTNQQIIETIELETGVKHTLGRSAIIQALQDFQGNKNNIFDILYPSKPPHQGGAGIVRRGSIPDIPSRRLGFKNFSGQDFVFLQPWRIEALEPIEKRWIQFLSENPGICFSSATIAAEADVVKHTREHSRGTIKRSISGIMNRDSITERLGAWQFRSVKTGERGYIFTNNPYGEIIPGPWDGYKGLSDCEVQTVVGYDGRLKELSGLRLDLLRLFSSFKGKVLYKNMIAGAFDYDKKDAEDLTRDTFQSLGYRRENILPGHFIPIPDKELRAYHFIDATTRHGKPRHQDNYEGFTFGGGDIFVSSVGGIVRLPLTQQLLLTYLTQYPHREWFSAELQREAGLEGLNDINIMFSMNTPINKTFGRLVANLQPYSVFRGLEMFFVSRHNRVHGKGQFETYSFRPRK
jgi:hypothetical protein